VAPALGGFLSRPASKYPTVFGPLQMFSTYPFLLPCISVFLVSLTGFVYGYFFLVETEPFLQRKAAREAGEASVPSEAAAEQLVMTHSSKPEVWLSSCVGERCVWLWNSPHTVRLVCLYSILAAHALVFEELWSVFCKAPRIGSGHESSVGLGFDTDQVGISLMIGGVLLLPFQVFVFPKISNRFGSWWIIMISQLCLIPLYLGFPAIAYISDTAAIWAALTLAQLFKIVCYSSVFTSVTMMIGCASEGPYLGFANGIAQASSSAARMVAPLAGGWLWSYSLSLDSPIRQWLVFVVLSSLVLLSTVLALKLPRDLGRKLEKLEQGDHHKLDQESTATTPIPNFQLLSPRRGLFAK